MPDRGSRRAASGCRVLFVEWEGRAGCASVSAVTATGVCAGCRKEGAVAGRVEAELAAACDAGDATVDG